MTVIEGPLPGEPEHPGIEPDRRPVDREPGPVDRPPADPGEPERDAPDAEPGMWAPGADGPPVARAPRTPDRNG
jgi:hypothetical protein